ncbi:exodeoxyribonuclease III [Yinghuangia soli]|uniref:Exodeoxyribonuclease III n=1 Tax=Yinghuangia soli TaxID=2908204 RepID=A0AA41Q6B6_9ACTN|nr:exodeoxyribonuclease III [Yinghuangia soli]MCF2531785.1 exodeoxyribonuclease III [Yinghuangia soli]
MRVATWNINSVGARLPRLLEWLESAAPDVLCLQELKSTADAFPYEAVQALGYEVAAHGDGRWNGVAILSRVGLDDVVRGLDGGPDYEGVQEPRAVSATCGPVRVWSVYVPNGREVAHAHYAYKLEWLKALKAAVADDAAGDRPFAVLGDYNVARADTDVWDIKLFEGATHVSALERAAIDELEAGGLAEVMPRALKYDVPFTFWDYRDLGFPKNKGMRIDLVLGNPAFNAAVKDSYVDREARRGKGASDHAPVVVDLEL